MATPTSGAARITVRSRRASSARRLPSKFPPRAPPTRWRVPAPPPSSIRKARASPAVSRRSKGRRPFAPPPNSKHIGICRRLLNNIRMFAPSRLGGILDLGLGLRWDRARLEREVASRASILSRQGIGRGSLIAIAHDGSANFFADLLAVWTLGATAACLDSGLTQSEFKTVIEFAEPAARLMGGGAVQDNCEHPT